MHKNYVSLVPFLRYSDILVENCHFDIPHLYLAVLFGATQF